jgi:hypothetical protein
MNWQSVHGALCRLARDKARYDVEEARWLIEADKLRVWEPLGLGSFVEYCERVLGYTPRQSIERLRVAKALQSLVQMQAAVAGGKLAWSAARELTRIVTPGTEAAWIEAAQHRTVHEIEAMTAGRKPGDLPDSPRKPGVQRCVVHMVVSQEAYAAFREAREQLELEAGHALEDDALLLAMAERACQPPQVVEDGTGPARRHQVLITVCAECKTGWREGAGANLAIDQTAVDTALCDAQVIDSTHAGDPERARTEISPATWRAVWRRDHGQCVVPGCRAAKFLDVHHIVRRSDGGSHDAHNLALVCSIHHRLLHDGKLRIDRTHTGLRIVGYRGAPYGVMPWDIEPDADSAGNAGPS